ncbi:MAG: glycosyltransferase family 2 protein [Prevotella sp.]|nr:glycosyltransferase family 2 protein [Prevotella sp.]
MEISVIIPVYNKASYIARCLDSIFSQDFPSFEVVAVDDGSTDGSGTLCDRWAEKEPRLHVYHIPNGGVTAARRFGVEHAEGRYIMFADADDQLTVHSLRRMHEAITQSGADEVIGPYVDQYGKCHDSGFRGLVACEPLVRDLLATRNSFCVLWGIIFKKELLDGCLGAPRVIVEREDSLMQIKCLMKSPKVFFISEPAYLHYEDVPNSRVEDLSMIRVYDKELRQTLSPQWERYRTAFVHHQIKVYEKFIDKRQFHVLDEYYRPLRQQLDKSIPLADRVALLLPPCISYLFVHYYKKIRRCLKGN